MGLSWLVLVQQVVAYLVFRELTCLASNGVGGFNQRCGQGFGDEERRDDWGYIIQVGVWGGRWEDAVLS